MPSADQSVQEHSDTDEEPRSRNTGVVKLPPRRGICAAWPAILSEFAFGADEVERRGDDDDDDEKEVKKRLHTHTTPTRSAIRQRRKA